MTLLLPGSGAAAGAASTTADPSSILGHYYQALSLVPQGLEVDYDSHDTRAAVFIRGTTGNASGYRRDGWAMLQFGERQAIQDEPGAITKSQGQIYGLAYLARNGQAQVRGEFTVEDYDGWQGGQMLTLTDAALGFDGRQELIVDVETTVGMGNGKNAYRIRFGAPPISAVRRLKRAEQVAMHGPVMGPRVQGVIGETLVDD